MPVCLLKLSPLYPRCIQNCASHMYTTMLRISPCFLTKPSEQPAKNNKTCCLCSRPHPHGEDITGGEEPVLLWPPRLKLIQNTDQTLCCKLPLHKKPEREELRGRICISGHPLSIYPGPRLDRRLFKLFSDTKHVPDLKLRRIHPSTGPFRPPGMSPELLQ